MRRRPPIPMFPAWSPRTRGSGFTLIELLVVMAIMAVLAALSFKVLRGRDDARNMDAGVSQLRDDLNYARQAAVRNRSTVAMVFLPREVLSLTGGDAEEISQVRRLQDGLYTHYALLTFRQPGDQPGRSRSRYLTEWRPLPDGVFIATNKFVQPFEGVAPFRWSPVPFPFGHSTLVRLPCVAFNSEGRLVQLDNSGLGTGGPLLEDVVIPLARGVVRILRDPATGSVLPQSLEVREVPAGNSSTNSAYNHIVVDRLTGRARIERPELQ